MLIDDIRTADRLAVELSVSIVEQVSTAELDRPTPCTEWTLAGLLAHMTVQHLGFAAAAEGHGSDPASWQAAPEGGDPVTAYTAAARRVLAAFAEPGVPDRLFELPEISTEIRFPGSTAIGFHTIDYVVHGWDVARSLGLGYDLPDELAPTALRQARSVPGEARSRPGAAFAPALAVPGTDPMNEVLGLLGRSPTWSAPR